MFTLRLIFNNKLSEKCILTDFVTFEKVNDKYYFVAYNEMNEDNNDSGNSSNNDDEYKELIDNIEYININHYCYYKMKDFFDAYQSLATSRKTFGSMVCVSDIHTKLTSNLEEKIYEEILEKINKKDKVKETIEDTKNVKNKKSNKKKKNISNISDKKSSDIINENTEDEISAEDAYNHLISDDKDDETI